MFDEYEDIALSDEKNINHITLDKYVGRNDCKTEVNLESVDEKPNFLFFLVLQFWTPKTGTITKCIEKTKNPSWNCNRGKVVQ